jgi:histone deacetylase 1/2
MPSESYTEIHTQSDKTGAEIEDDSEEHSSVRSDPEAASPASSSVPMQRSVSLPASPARLSPTASPASTPVSTCGAAQDPALGNAAVPALGNAASPGSSAGSRALTPGSIGSSVATSADSPPAPPPPPPGPRTHLQQGIRQPKKYTDGTIRYGMLSSTGEPRNLPDALNDPNWRAAMQGEYDALMLNKTWTLVPPSSNKKYH